MAFLIVFTIPGLVLGLVALAVIDRMGLWANRRFRTPWRRDDQGRGVSAVGVDELSAFFQGSKRHQLDEKRSSLILRDEENDGAPPRTKVDLERGTAVIRRSS
ncbi:hypothetical protein J4573_44760 [Actinomadura barringtoniae]|uniref:Uncharacterized protein n=1 Tax=Actinomadura barringtoniae TaxID=1427535 RepID=A0A939PQB1_9ACTN|nr:DUF6191 domain-containing protein [Actinomadura barringtoniae]MBO2454263.1 hypothetical protein [Actinomadura barringtoniae]